MQKVYAKIKELGGEVLVISFTPPARVAAYVERYPLPFPVVSDANLAAYQAFSLGRISWGQIFHPGVLWRFLKMMVRGWFPKKPGQGEDLLQMGGDFVLDKERRLVYAHPSTEPTDRPSAEEILKAVGNANARP